MTRLFYLTLVSVLASHVPIHAQQKKDPPKTFRNGIGMKLVWMPPGYSLMGSPIDEEKRGHDEIQHKVTPTKGSYMGVFTVTQEQWQGGHGERSQPFQRRALGENGDRQVANDNSPTELRRIDQIIKVYGEPDVRFFFGSFDTEFLLFCDWGYAVHVDRKGNVERFRRLTRDP